MAHASEGVRDKRGNGVDNETPKGRLLYPTVYVAREGLIQEAKQQLAEIVERIGPTDDMPVRYDPEPRKPRKAAEPRLLCTPVRNTVYRGPKRYATWSRR